MEEISRMLGSTSAEAVLLAALTVVLTAVIKIPIKHYARKRPLSSKITQFIPLIPFVIGGILAVLVGYLKTGVTELNDRTIELWIGISGSSIAFYSCYENIRDSGRVAFADKLQDSIYRLLQEVFQKKGKAALKDLTLHIAESYYRAKGNRLNDFYAEMQELLKDDLQEAEIGKLSKQIECLWEELYGADIAKLSENFACTATEKYEYEVRKERIVRKIDSDDPKNDKGDD